MPSPSPSAMSSTLAHATCPAPKAGRFKKSVSLPHETVEYLKSWMMSPAHVAHPYPTEQEKAAIMAETGIELKQLTNWFVNNRKRFWKPRVEAQLQHCPPPVPVPASAPGGGPSAALQPTNPKPQRPQRAPPFPLPLHGAAASAALCATAQGSAPAAVATASGARPQDDPHTISEGSGSSACNSDDEASAAPSDRTCSALGATAARRLDPRLAAVGPSAASAPGPSRLPVDGYRRHEEVDVQVLRPERPDGAAPNAAEPLPGLRDVTIRAGVPRDRVVAAFKCPIAYTVPYDIEHDRKKIQSRRDGEVLRVKKHYLKLYLATQGVHSASSPVAAVGAAAPAVATSNVPAATSLAATFGAVASAAPARTRAFSCTAVAQDRDAPPPKRHRAHSEPRIKGVDEWRSLCQNADSLFCESLPGLEDAVRMFGYLSQ